MAAPTLADVIALLTKTTGELSEKLSASKKEAPSKVTKTSPVSPGLSGVIGSNIRQKPQQERVVKELIPISLDDIGAKALRKIKALIPAAKTIKKEEAIKEESGFMKFIKGLIGPALMILSGLAALIMGFLNDGPLKGLLTLLGKGGILAGVAWLKNIFKKKILGMLSFVKKLLPIDFLEKAFTSLKGSFKKAVMGIVSGTKWVLKKVNAIMPVNFFKKIFDPIKAGISKLTSGLLKPFTGIAKGLSKGLFTKVLSGAAKLLKPVLRRLPGIGSLIDWYSAYTRFKKGDVVGGLIDVASGIASIFPGVGTALSIGLGVLNAFLDYKAGGSDVNGGKAKPKSVMLGDFFKKIKNKLILGIWNMIPNFEIFGVNVKNRLASMMGLDIPGIEKEIEQANVAETLAKEEKIKADNLNNVEDGESKQLDESTPDPFNLPESQNSIPDEDVDPYNGIEQQDIPSEMGIADTEDKTSIETAKIKELTIKSNTILEQQLDILHESKQILVELVNKISSLQNTNNNVVSTRNTVNNIFTQNSIRDLQRAYT